MRPAPAALLLLLAVLLLLHHPVAAQGSPSPSPPPSADLPILVLGQSCPTAGPIPFQYLTTVGAGPNGAQPVLSSNMTLAPFSTPAIPIEELYIKTKRPLLPATCDRRGRCIEAYELIASITNVDVGFKDPRTNLSLMSQFLTYDGSFPGPAFVVQQGVQALVRLQNHIFCNTSTWTPINSTGAFYQEISGLTLHLHGAASLSPFDGWTADNIMACQWKDYVYSNNNLLEALWYHDHSMGITAQSVGCGLAGTYQVLPCNASQVPKPLQALAPAQYLVISDNLFIQDEGSDFINPSMFQNKALRDVVYNNQTFAVTGISGDHMFVNGRPWPVVTVQRRPYWFIVHNAAQSRVLKLLFVDPATNASVNTLPGHFWVVGSDAGLRDEPTTAQDALLMGSGERYQVVIDFSTLSVGTELILTNLDSELAPYPVFCYTHLVMKFVVGGTEPATAPFNPLYFHIPFQENGQNNIDTESVQAACDRAMNGGADVVMQTTVNLVQGQETKMFTNLGGAREQWQAAMVGDPSSVQFRRRLRRLGAEPDAAAAAHERPSLEEGAQALEADAATRRRGVLMTHSVAPTRPVHPVDPAAGLKNVTVSQYLPRATPTNGWSTWWLYNNASGPGGGGVHPIHMHLVNLYLCGRRNNVTGEGIHSYEMYTPKDTLFLGASDEVAFITRTGPNEGNYFFHCHNLQHEDDGLMAVYNSTSTKRAKPGTFWQGTLSAERFSGGFASTPDSPELFLGQDPLVFSDPSNPAIGHDLYSYESMPPSHQRTDPKHPGRPQPITATLLKKVLKRNYYKVFYPDQRTSLSKPVKGNNYAVMCSPKPRRG